MTEKTGHKKELSDASAAMAEAMADHATALNSQATAMAASIAAPLYTQQTELKTMIQDLAAIVTNARQADLNWRTAERIQRDTQHDRLYAELDRLARAAEESGSRLGKLEGRMNNSEEDRASLNRRLARIEQILADRPQQREIEHQALLAAIRGGPDAS